MGKIGIIIAREFNQRVRQKMFIITTLLTPLLMVGIMAATIYIQKMGSIEEKVIMVIDHSGAIAPNLQSEGNIKFELANKSIEELRAEKQDVFGILLIGEDVMTNPGNITLYCYKSATMELESSISRQVRSIIEEEKLKQYDIGDLGKIMDEIKTNVLIHSYLLDDEGGEKESSTILATVIAFIFGFMIYMFVFTYGAMVMNGVIEEKNSKVLEIMVSSVRPFELMMGKIIGVALVAITQFMLWIVLIGIIGTIGASFMSGDLASASEAMSQNVMSPENIVPGVEMPGADSMPGSDMLNGMSPEVAAAIRGATDMGLVFRMLICFLLYFIGGYLLYASMYAAIGSAVDSMADSQQLQLPVTIPLVLAFVVLMSVIQDPYSKIAFWFSMIPFTSPIIMLARLPYGVPLWELALSLAILYGSFVVMVWLAGKIYRVGIFMTGKKPTWKEIVKWMKYKY